MKVPRRLRYIVKSVTAMTSYVKETCHEAADEIEKMDGLLARAADALNNSPRMVEMDLGSEITEFRRGRL